MGSRGIATRIALAALASAAVGLGILALGVTVVGGQVFTDLMMQAGESAEHARAMYDQSVSTVVIAAVLVAALRARRFGPVTASSRVELYRREDFREPVRVIDAVEPDEVPAIAETETSAYGPSSHSAQDSVGAIHRDRLRRRPACQ